MSNIRIKAKMKTLEELTEKISKASKEEGKELPPMATFAMGMQTMMTIEMYETHLSELGGHVNLLLTALESGGFTDEQGTALTDTLTFQNLKNRLKDDSDTEDELLN